MFATKKKEMGGDHLDKTHTMFHAMVLSVSLCLSLSLSVSLCLSLSLSVSLSRALARALARSLSLSHSLSDSDCPSRPQHEFMSVHRELPKVLSKFVLHSIGPSGRERMSIGRLGAGEVMYRPNKGHLAEDKVPLPLSLSHTHARTRTRARARTHTHTHTHTERER
eukprot:COSAG03_NODE_6680_length_1020_cov_4.769815_1_plen_165_part_10